MTDEVNRDPIEPLRKQWEFEKSPKLSLQLAEKYGRRNDFLSAITVLRSGLARHPRHISSKVLLGRYLVELEQWPEARETLESVTSVDPTQLIANKLLVRTCLAVGDRAEARNRLDLYTLLNESDPDIEELERAFAGAPGDDTASSGAVEPEAGAANADADADADSARTEPEPLPIEGIVAPVEAVQLTPAAAPAPPIESAVATGVDEPFGDLFGLEARERAKPAPVIDDIFELARPAEAPTPPSVETVFPLEEAALAGEAEPEPEPATADDESAEREAAAEAPAVEPVEPSPEEPPPATVSLGRLYLEQGHREDAERTFLAVLDADPADAAARTGLTAARGSGEFTVTALDLVSREVLAASPRERKRAVLTGYLDRLRGGATAG